MDGWNTSLPENEQISRSTVSRRLRENGLHGRVAVKKSLLHKDNIKKRLKLAKTHKDWTVDQRMKVLWADESKFKIFGFQKRRYVRRRSNERYHPQYIVPTGKHGGGNVLGLGLL